MENDFFLHVNIYSRWGKFQSPMLCSFGNQNHNKVHNEHQNQQVEYRFKQIFARIIIHFISHTVYNCMSISRCISNIFLSPFFLHIVCTLQIKAVDNSGRQYYLVLIHYTPFKAIEIQWYPLQGKVEPFANQIASNFTVNVPNNSHTAAPVRYNSTKIHLQDLR